jgi:hypothetical protein
MSLETTPLNETLLLHEIEDQFNSKEQARRSMAAYLRAACRGDLRRLPRIARQSGITLATARHLIFEYT